MKGAGGQLPPTPFLTEYLTSLLVRKPNELKSTVVLSCYLCTNIFFNIKSTYMCSCQISAKAYFFLTLPNPSRSNDIHEKVSSFTNLCYLLWHRIWKNENLIKCNKMKIEFIQDFVYLSHIPTPTVFCPIATPNCLTTSPPPLEATYAPGYALIHNCLL